MMGRSTKQASFVAIAATIFEKDHLPYFGVLENERSSRLRKRRFFDHAELSRYADDFVCTFELESDAQRFYEALPKRLAKFGLEVAEDKTNILRFDKDSKR